MSQDLPVVLLVVVALLLLLNLLRPQRPRSERWRLALLERKLDAVCRQLDVSYPQPLPEPVRALARAGRTVEAIKLLRRERNLDLTAAKAAVAAEQPLAAIERQANALLQGLGLDPRESARALVHDLLRAHQKVAAIQVWRAATGAGLKDSKAAVDSMERGLPPPAAP